MRRGEFLRPGRCQKAGDAAVFVSGSNSSIKQLPASKNATRTPSEGYVFLSHQRQAEDVFEKRPRPLDVVDGDGDVGHALDATASCARRVAFGVAVFRPPSVACGLLSAHTKLTS